MELNVEVEASSDALDEGFDVIVKMVEGFVDGDGGTFVVVSVETENGSELHSFSVGPYNIQRISTYFMADKHYKLNEE